jgi:hypothetical protein
MDNILGEWRGAGLWPATPVRVLNNLFHELPPVTPQAPIQATTTNLDFSLSKSSPPEAVELSKSNKRFTESLRECPAVVPP